MGERSKLTTLCYIEKDDSYLMLHRVSKKNDENKDKWIGIGGHFEEGESPEDCLLREAKEETGLTLTSWKFRGIVTFVSDVWGTEYMCLYTADGYTGEMISCNEGVLEWIKKEDLLKLNLWEGDKIFLKLLQENAPFFSLKLVYKGDELTEAVLNGENLKKSRKSIIWRYWEKTNSTRVSIIFRVQRSRKGMRSKWRILCMNRARLSMQHPSLSLSRCPTPLRTIPISAINGI